MIPFKLSLFRTHIIQLRDVMVGKRWVNFIVIFQFSSVNCAVLILTIHSSSSEINSSPFILMFYRYYIPLLIIIATLLIPEANWICNLGENKIPGVAVDVFHIGTFWVFFPARLKFPGCERQGGSLIWGLITAHLSGSVYSGLGETFWTSGLLFSVCSLHSITQESSPGGGSPCTLLKVTVRGCPASLILGLLSGLRWYARLCALLCFTVAVFWYRHAETAEGGCVLWRQGHG